MRVLVGCEFSGRVRDAFKEMGHDAWSCDLVPTESPGQHIQGDVLGILGEKWDMAIFHPPCTYLSSSGLHWNKRGTIVDGVPRAIKTQEALEFVKKLMAAPIPKVCIENPVGCISTQIAPPTQVIQPYYFGENASKQTCLWLRGLPTLNVTMYVPGRVIPSHNGKLVMRWANQTDSGQNKLGPSARRASARSETYMGIASAMARQWGR